MCTGQLALPIAYYNYYPIEQVRGLSHRHVVGHLVEVTAVFCLLYADCFEQENFPFHVHTHYSHIPVTWCNFCLFNPKLAPFVQVSQQAASELHILREMAIERCKSLLFLIDPHLPFHVVENAGLTGRRLKIRIWSEA